MSSTFFGKSFPFAGRCLICPSFSSFLNRPASSFASLSAVTPANPWTVVALYTAIFTPCWRGDTFGAGFDVWELDGVGPVVTEAGGLPDGTGTVVPPRLA